MSTDRTDRIELPTGETLTVLRNGSSTGGVLHGVPEALQRPLWWLLATLSGKDDR